MVYTTSRIVRKSEVADWAFVDRVVGDAFETQMRCVQTRTPGKQTALNGENSASRFHSARRSDREHAAIVSEWKKCGARHDPMAFHYLCEWSGAFRGISFTILPANRAISPGSRLFRVHKVLSNGSRALGSSSDFPIFWFISFVRH